MKDITQNIGNCFRKFFTKGLILNPIIAYSPIYESFYPIVNSNWTPYQFPVNNKIKVKCY